MNSQELKEALERHSIDPLKARGQHFLSDQSVVAAAVEAAEVGPGDNVLEIGPGPGVLSDALIAAGARVVAVDIDRRFSPLLGEMFEEKPFSLVIGDALSYTNAQLTESFGGDRYKVVANIPYAITSELVVKFVSEDPAPVSATLLMQKEVAERIVAKDGKANRLAILVAAYSTSRIIKKVPPGAFVPPPQVDSAVIHISRKQKSEIEEFFAGMDPKRYFSFVAAAFAQPRKQLKNNVSGLVPGGEERVLEILESLGLSAQVRPEAVPLEKWRELVFELTK